MNSEQAQQVKVGDTVIHEGIPRRVAAIRSDSTGALMFQLESLDGQPYRLAKFRLVDLPSE